MRAAATFQGQRGQAFLTRLSQACPFPGLTLLGARPRGPWSRVRTPGPRGCVTPLGPAWLRASSLFHGQVLRPCTQPPTQQGPPAQMTAGAGRSPPGSPAPSGPEAPRAPGGLAGLVHMYQHTCQHTCQHTWAGLLSLPRGQARTTPSVSSCSAGPSSEGATPCLWGALGQWEAEGRVQWAVGKGRWVEPGHSEEVQTAPSLVCLQGEGASQTLSKARGGRISNETPPHPAAKLPRPLPSAPLPTAPWPAAARTRVPSNVSKETCP